MARDLTEKVPETVLEAFGWGGASSDKFEKGLFNTHWLVTREDENCVVRRYNTMRTRAAAAWEQTLVEFAGTRGWPVSTPMADSNGATIVEHDGFLWAAGPYLEGEAGAADSPAMFHICGRLLARLHRDLAGFEVEGQRPDFGKTWELDAWVAPANVGSFNDLLAAFALEYPELAALIRRQRYRNLRDLSRLKYPDLPEMPIHGDFQRWNLLWHEGQVTGLLDFDFCRRDALVCDIAPLLMPFQPLEQRLARALFEGYQSVRPLSDSEWDLLPSLVRAALLKHMALVLAGWRTQGGPVDAVVRTMTVRFPAFEAAEPAYLALRKEAVR